MKIIVFSQHVLFIFMGTTAEHSFFFKPCVPWLLFLLEVGGATRR